MARFKVRTDTGLVLDQAGAIVGALESLDLGIDIPESPPPDPGPDPEPPPPDPGNVLGELSGHVELGPRTYLTDGIRLTGPTTIRGVPGLTRIMKRGGGAPILRSNGDWVTGLHGVTFDGDGLPGDGLKITGGLTQIGECVVVDCEGGFGIRLVNTYRSRVVHNRVFECGKNGISIEQTESRHDGAIVAYNHVTDIRDDQGGSLGQRGNGIRTWRASGVLIAGNNIRDCAHTGIRVNPAATEGETIVLGNIIHRVLNAGMFIEFGAQRVIVQGNLIEDVPGLGDARGGGKGITFTNMNDGTGYGTIIGNRCRNCAGERGVIHAQGDGTRVIANHVEAVDGFVPDAGEPAYQIGFGAFLGRQSFIGNGAFGPYAVGVRVANGDGSVHFVGNDMGGLGIDDPGNKLVAELNRM